MFRVVNKWTVETFGFRIGFGLAFGALLFVVGWAWVVSPTSHQETQLAPNLDVRMRVFEHMEPSPVEFEIRLPKENVLIKSRYYQEVGIDGSEWIPTVIQQAAEIFVEWAEKKEFELSENGRLQVGLTVAAVSHDLLNDRYVFYWSKHIREQSPNSSGITGLYGSKPVSGNHTIFVSADNERSGRLVTKTIAHEVAHFLLDYFRIYDNYYQRRNYFPFIKRGIDREAPAYEFQRYFSSRTRIKKVQSFVSGL
jgi:hypothetical protein